MLGLLLVSQLPQPSKLEIEFDCSQAIDLITLIISNHHPCKTVIDNCRLLLTKLEDFKFLKVKREHNGCAHLLAGEGRKPLIPLSIYERTHDFVLTQYQHDISIPTNTS